MAIGSPKPVINYISGYKLPFNSLPTQRSAVLANTFQKVCKLEMKTVVNNLLNLGAVELCSPSKGQFLSPIFLVPKPDGTKRFIFNLKSLNRHIINHHFKMEDIRTAINLMYPNCYMTTIDLKDAYYVIPVHKMHRKYLRFQFECKLYQFTCLPFGLCTSPRIFTKVLKPAVRHLRQQGITLVIYLDDILIISTTYDKCKSDTQSVIKLMENLGFVINCKKSCLTPSKQIKFLGFILNSETMKVELPLDKREKIDNKCHWLISRERCSILRLAEVIGLLISAVPTVPYGLLYTKILERQKYKALLANNGNFMCSVNIDTEMKADLSWWISNIKRASAPIRIDEFSQEIFSDASKSGWGASCAYRSTGGRWTNETAKCHINYLELVAAYYGLRCYAADAYDTQLLLRIDNTTAIAYINKMGSIKYPHLYNISRKIWQFCEDRKLWIYATYIPSKENCIADYESRSFKTEWSLGQKYFDMIKLSFGMPTIDLFASHTNTKCDRYCSWQADPFSIGVNAFTLCWGNEFPYIFPPFNIIPRVLRKLQSDKCAAIVVVPLWDSQPWFPIYMRLLIQEPLILQPCNDLLLCDSRSHPLAKTMSLMAGVLSGKHY